MNPRDDALSEEEREDDAQEARSADGEPLVDKGTADSARDPEEKNK